MPSGPETGAREAARIAQLYSAAELELLHRVAKNIAAGGQIADWERTKLAQLNQWVKDQQPFIEQVEHLAATQLREAVQKAVSLGSAAAAADLVRAGFQPLPPARSRALQILASDVQQIPAQASAGIRHGIKSATQRVISDTTSMVTMGALTHQQAVQLALNRLADRGITGFTDRAGRNWSLPAYTEMATRTALGQASVQGHVDTLISSGVDLVQILPGPRSCPICDAWAFKVLSLTGARRNAGDESDTVVVGTLDDARADGWGHPNCRCSLGAYFPGFELPTALPDPAGYVAEQQQRYLERQVRHWQRRQAVALTQAEYKKASGKAQAWRGRLKEHAAANKLPRRTARERALTVYEGKHMTLGQMRREMAAKPVPGALQPRPHSEFGLPKFQMRTKDWEHILYGEANNPSQGGHMYGVGRLGKTEFPQGWDSARIKSAVNLVLEQPQKLVMHASQQRLSLLRYVDETIIEVQLNVLKNNRYNFHAAFPVSGTQRNLPQGRKEIIPLNLNVLDQ